MPSETIDFTERIRTIPDWPKAGIMFRDITPLLHHGPTFRALIAHLSEHYRDHKLNFVAGIEARGFILGAAVAYELGLGFIPIRKKGKLPFETLEEDYLLEYGSATLEIHADACHAGDRILLLDDLIATGGTLIASAKLLQRLGATVVEAAVIVELPELKGRALVEAEGIALQSLCSFGGH